MPYDHGAGVTPMQVFEQSPHGSLLFSRACVVGLTAGIKSPFVADADGVGIVMMPFYEAVGADHPLRATWLDRSVTTYHVMVTDTQLIMSVFAVPCIDLSCRRCLVGLHCRTMNN